MSITMSAKMADQVASETIRGSRSKVAIYLVGSLALAYGGATMRDHAFVGWVSVILFGSAALVFLWWIVRPPLLLLDSNGFTLEGGFVRTPKQVRWGDIDSFFVYSLPRGSDAIGYNLRHDPKRTSPPASISKEPRIKVLLPGKWPLSTGQMVDALNTYRLEALTRQGAQPAGQPSSD